VKALDGLLMTQRQMTLKDESGYYNVSELYRPPISDAFLADTVVDMTRL